MKTSRRDMLKQFGRGLASSTLFSISAPKLLAENSDHPISETTILPQPNILLIYTDQQRYDTIHALGNEVIQTPNLDRLVSEGIAFTLASTACPVCKPARWSLHTGQWTSTHQCYSNHHLGSRPVFDLPTLLRDDGYRTGLIGKNHSFLEPADFDYWQENPLSRNPDAERKRRLWENDIGIKDYPRLADEAVPGGIEGDPEYAKTDEAIDFMKSVDGRPFFLWLSYLNPHTPYWVPEPFFSMYRDAPISEPPVEPEGLEAAGKPYRQRFHQWNNDAILPFSRERIMTMRRVYYGMISLIDREIGRLLDFLEKRGLRENTLIVFTSDHGDYLGDHGLLTKSPAMYDCLTRVPLIVSWPARFTPKEISTQLVSQIDLLPTLLEAAHIPCPKAAQGISIFPWIEGTQTRSYIRPAVISEYGVPGIPYNEQRLEEDGLLEKPFRNPWNSRLPWEGNPVSLSGRITMVRTRYWKYVEESDGQCELYDLRLDPYELNNVYGNSSLSPVQSNLQNHLTSWRRSLE